MRASRYDRAADDWYVEPQWIVHALLDAERIWGPSWDPACGGGNIPMAIWQRGGLCVGTDIAVRANGFGQMDFFSRKKPPIPSDHIISNPPYKIIEQFISHALHIVEGKVCLLARLALLEGQKRRQLLETTPLARVWVSSRRVSMPPGGTDIKATGGSIAYAWFVWEHGHQGPPTIGWI